MPLIEKLNWNLNDLSIVLASNSTKKTDANSNEVIFTVKDTKLYVTAVTFSAKDNKKLSKLLSKEFERSMHSN